MLSNSHGDHLPSNNVCVTHLALRLEVCKNQIELKNQTETKLN